MDAAKNRAAGRRRRRRRVRKKVFGEPERPRLSVFRSLNHFYAQVIDDVAGHTLAAASSLSKELRKKVKSGGDVGAAKAVGELLGRKAKKAGIVKVALDRNGYKYHGRVKAFAEAAREAGLEF